MASLVPFVQHFHKTDGTIASGYYLTFYAGGTSNKQDAYTTQAGTVATSNPLQLNSRGEAEWWLDPTLSYKIVLSSDSAGTDVIKEMDLIRSISAGDDFWQFGESSAVTAASTINLDSMTTSFGHISGNTGIDTVTLAQGTVRYCIFDGTPTLTHSANLILNNNGSDITIEAGDAMLFVGEGSGVTRGHRIKYDGDNAAVADVATVAYRVDSSEITVTAHATTADIFGAAGNSILWDDSGGPTTTTDFANAPKAGLVRECRCNAASVFISSANLLIEGLQSGNSITLGSGAYFTVRAVTKTKFRMTYTYSGEFTITGTGFSGTAPTATVRFHIENGNGVLALKNGLSGTSNSTSFTATGFPACFNTTQILPAMAGTDNGTNITLFALYLPGGEMTFYKGVYGTGWTASGTKGLGACSFSMASFGTF